VNAHETANIVVAALEQAADTVTVDATVREIGHVLNTGDGIARIAGLPGTKYQELLRFADGILGVAFNLDDREIGCVLLGDDAGVTAGDPVARTGNVVRTPVGKDLLGRIVDPLGTPLDGGPQIVPERFEPIEREAPPILARAPVAEPLATGIKSIDSMIPIGRGQRELIIGDRSTGKTTVALNAILNQAGTGVICVYVAICQRASTIARVVKTLREHGAMEYTVVVVADADSPPGLRFIAPYAGCTISEYFTETGQDTLIVYDDLTKHAQTYREISLLLRRPPGREAYPGDIFYLHSRLLERAAHWDDEHGGGSQTALPIIETQAQNISAYVPTNLISITDGQIYMNPDLFQGGFLPAVDIGLSVSRVGGKTQIPAMKKIAQTARLTYTQFIELEQFAKFGTTMEAHTKAMLDKGRRLRELLKQSAFDPVPLAEQVLLLHLADNDALMQVDVAQVRDLERRFRQALRERHEDVLAKIAEGDKPSDEEIAAVLTTATALAETGDTPQAQPAEAAAAAEPSPPAGDEEHAGTA